MSGADLFIAIHWDIIYLYMLHKVSNMFETFCCFI
jgi:hypothetical protein